jgi:hypothetical protein
LRNVSPQLKDLYITDFEMARIKEMQDAKLLRFYLKLEHYLPVELMFLASRMIKIIVQEDVINLTCSTLPHHGCPGYDM